MFGNPQVPQSVGQGQRIVRFGGECAGSLERGNRGGVVVPNDLVKDADPQLCLSFTPDIPEALVQLDCSLKEGEFGGDVLGVSSRPRCRIEKASVEDPTARHGQIGRHRAQLSVRLRIRATVSPPNAARSYNRCACSRRSSTVTPISSTSSQMTNVQRGGPKAETVP